MASLSHTRIQIQNGRQVRKVYTFDSLILSYRHSQQVASGGNIYH